MNKKLPQIINKNLFITLLLILFLSLMSAFVSWQISQQATRNCIETLEQSAENLVSNINFHIQNNQEQLSIIADMIAFNDEMDSPEVIDILSSYHHTNMFSRLELLLPDNTVITGTGERISADGILDFKEEAARKRHISDGEPDLQTPDHLILRNYVPVMKDDTVAAMLYAVIELESLPQLWETKIYNGQAQIYIIEGISGNFIVDTWHQTLGNMHDLSSRKVKRGYSIEKLKSDQASGTAGHIVCASQTTGEYLYYYYMPIGVNHWMLGLSVPESVAFATAIPIRKALYLFTFTECISFLLYFMWMFKRTRHETYEKQKRLELFSYIYDVEKLLFSAHLKKEQINQALEKIAVMTTAEYAFYKTYGIDNNPQVFLWSSSIFSDQEAIVSLLGNTTLFQSYFSDGHKHLILHSLPDIKQLLPKDYYILYKNDIQNLMVIPIKNLNDESTGILGVMNMKHKWESAELLENVALSFSMLHNNLQSYHTIKEMGETDFLTGLLNRNSYQKALPEYEKKPHTSLACIYADANGLHELNNSKGHESGDIMLKAIASAFKEQFDPANIYRIGGDEFVAFSIDETLETVTDKIMHIKNILTEKGYHSSIGVSYRTDALPIEDLVKEAEQNMYIEKKKYYEQSGNERRSR